jgi:hypothetical protein
LQVPANTDAGTILFAILSISAALLALLLTFILFPNKLMPRSGRFAIACLIYVGCVHLLSGMLYFSSTLITGDVYSVLLVLSCAGLVRAIESGARIASGHSCSFYEPLCDFWNADARSLAIGTIVVSSVAEVAARGMTTQIRAAFYLVLALVVVAGVAAVYNASGIYQLDHINHDGSVEMVCPLL